VGLLPVHSYRTCPPYVLTVNAEGNAKLRPNFRECVTERDTDDCPEMIVIPSGSFVMGSSSVEADRPSEELPRHSVSINKTIRGLEV